MSDDVATPGPKAGKGKKIVIFADGTGNSFYTQESNVWRLYEALDKTDKADAAKQIVRYIPGVGTSGNVVLRVIDGATGIGVPSNVRKLYRFLCWNWEKDDEIYLFGFSRGAFTVRCLAAMVAMQGLMPTKNGSERVTGPEMNRNSRSAWLAYRTETAPFVPKGTSIWNPMNWKMNPVTSLIRVLRDRVSDSARRVRGQKTHQEVLDSLPVERRGGEVKIQFMGLFDTVEAYGMPVEEMCSIWNRLIWPIRFRNQRCSFIVQKVRHALSLDDERRSFHPIRFDVSERPDKKPVPETQELWFAGVHSDVGGGYPDDETAFEPLLWIAGEASQEGLDFDGDALNRYRKRLYPQAQIHDSRQGLASLYRYAPRFVDADDKHGGKPVVHHSVIEKQQFGANGYAPLGLPEGFLVYPSTGQGWMNKLPYEKARDPSVFSALSRLVLRRRNTNWMSISLILLLVAIPIVDWFRGTTFELSSASGWIAGVLGAVLPSWAGVWLKALLYRWWLSLPAIAALWAIYSFNRTLGYQIKDRAGKLWVAPT
jgi:uncharacterized protein (DUF2235 family)